MDDKLVRLITCLAKQEDVSTSTLSESLCVSERTVRAYIKRAKELLEGTAEITTIKGQGYHLEVLNPELLDCWLNKEDQLPQTSNERVAYILDDLLNRSDWVTVDELSEILYVSRKTISIDLKQAEEFLARFDLRIVRKSHYGIQIEGTEFNKRLCLASLVTSEEYSGSCHATVENNELIADVTKLVVECVEHHDVSLNDFAIRNLVIHIVVAINRIKQQRYVVGQEDSLKRIQCSYEYSVAQKLVNCLSSEFDVEFPQTEVAYIAIHLASKKMFKDISESPNLVITDDVFAVTRQMIDLVWSSFRFDFRNDLELHMSLARHIVPLSVRLHYNLQIENPLLTDIQYRMPLAYLMAMESSTILAKEYEATLSEHEVAYLALAFALALERKRTELPKKNVLCVCATGLGTSKILGIRIKEEFGPYIGSITTCNLSQISQIDFSHIDYVFSTVEIESPLPVPVCYSGFLLDDINKDLIVKDLLRRDEQEEFAKHFSEHLFFSHLAYRSKEEVLNFLVSQLCNIEKSNISVSEDEFRALVFDRETLAMTAFGNLVALPHPSRPVSERTCVAVGLLDNPIDWDGHDVAAVFLISVSCSEDEKTRLFNKNMASLLMDKEAICSLVKHQSFSTFVGQITSSGDGLRKRG